MEILLKIIHVVASVFLVLVVLLQSGRGGGMGAAFGGASSQIFGGRGASNFLSRITTGAAMVFFMTSLTLSMLSSRHRSVILSAPAPASAPADAAPEGGSARDVNKGAPNEAAEPAKKPDAPADTPPGVPEPKPAQ